MSLRAFHILFILVTTLLAAGCAAWGFATGMPLTFEIVCVCIAMALVAYGFCFFRKTRNLII